MRFIGHVGVSEEVSEDRQYYRVVGTIRTMLVRKVEVKGRSLIQYSEHSLQLV